MCVLSRRGDADLQAFQVFAIGSLSLWRWHSIAICRRPSLLHEALEVLAWLHVSVVS